MTDPGYPVGRPEPIDGIRDAVRAREQRIREAADLDCTRCRGKGFTYGYVGPGKTASYPCRCTGIPECE